MRLVDRYLVRQLTLPFLIGLLLFVIILLGEVAYHIGSTIAGGRVPASLIIQYLLLRAPRAVVWSLPFGALLGVSMAVTSLAHGGEITAMRAGGASFGRICVALIVAGMLAGAAGIALNQLVVPGSMQAAQKVFAEMMRSQPVVSEAHEQFFRDEQGRFFYVRDMLPAQNVLRQVMIWRRDSEGNIREITAAGEAQLQGEVWILRSGATVRLDERGRQVAAETFTSRRVQLTHALQEYYADRRSPAELAPYELQELILVREQTGADTHQLQVYLHFKYSIPLACLVFTLIGAPLAHRYARLGTYVGVVIAILVVFLYNGVRSWTLALGLAGSLPPTVAGWTPDVLFGLLGLILFATER
jgi:LPS export ABC transporter permease LptG